MGARLEVYGRSERLDGVVPSDLAEVA